jgi:hypothetical protein
MNKKEALSKLELEEGSTSSEINTQYQEFYNEFQMRITNAPTEHQRKLYQKKLEELTTAFNILGGENQESNTHDLPGIAESEVLDSSKLVNSSASKEINFESEEQHNNNKASSDTKNILLTEALALINMTETALPSEIKKAYISQKAELETEYQKARIETIKHAYKVELNNLDEAWSVIEPWIQDKKAEEKKVEVEVKKVEPKSKPILIQSEQKNSFGKIAFIGAGVLFIGVIIWFSFSIKNTSNQGSNKDKVNTSVNIKSDSISKMNFQKESKAKNKENSKQNSDVQKEIDTRWKKKFDLVDDFSEGLYVVTLNEKKGYADKNGNIVIPLKYDVAWGFYRGMANVEINNKGGFINKSGKEVIPLIYDYISLCQQDNNLIAVELNKKYGWINRKGDVIIPIKYDDIDSYRQFETGAASVKLNGKYGLINKKGDLLTPIKYEGLEYLLYSGGLLEVRSNGKHGFINKQGEEVIPLKYEAVGIFFNEITEAKLNNKWGFINKKGEIVLSFKYDSAHTSWDKEITVELNGKTFKIDSKGNCIENCD